MARLHLPTSDSRESSLYRDPTPLAQRQHSARSRNGYTGTLSPTPALSSDKENEDGEATQRKRMDKGKGRAVMGPPSSVPTPNSDEEDSPRASKRRRLQERGTSVASTITNGEPLIDLQYYDPDQDPEERRELRKEMRMLTRDFNEKRDELLQGGTKDLADYITRSNSLMHRVKQTSDATIDARFLVAASDLALRKTNQLVMGDSSTGIDIDQFVSKCITFMQNGGDLDDDEHLPASTQARARRHRRQTNDEDDEDQEETGDALSWDVLGEQACFSTNRRPPVSGFLLGPLSVQKRVRATQTQRRARLRRDPQLEQRPESLEPEDLQRAENSNLMTLVKKNRERLGSVIEERMEKVQEELERLYDDPTEDEQDDVLDKYRIIRNEDGAGIYLFEYVVNPRSFGQTVENLFYTSFLIREGSVQIGEDRHGLPTIWPAEPRSMNEQRAQNITRHQAVFSIDYPMWQQMVRLFEIDEAIIPHRNDEQPTQTVRGWYG
ncbi:uncharacterized protein K452DRAFT_350008 [Aplosporella prunicola CBS 121167]|uniref:Non-structural maintenance of chromosomes element 4 n=1 Tax=Aplosporella prunicola CBS 121167 TaxID=1176127 RepID=A0A6A6BLN3_9PEZI|nr:uncharacterized protein K452DRAFT_350008 [Aplosporella prunicola CBS 121167]KAF2144313.1 hypothetical protein K452DRAFT_350008 [Aplosporella prunicola CBS 121167]